MIWPPFLQIRLNKSETSALQFLNKKLTSAFFLAAYIYKKLR